MPPLYKPQAVLFDLDGTLADTAPDLAYALNVTLEHYGLVPLPFEKIRPVVSHGGNALLKLGFNITPETPRFAEKHQHLLQVYHNNLCQGTCLFNGMESVLQYLEKTCIAWGIVTNKPAWLTNPLVDKMSLSQRTPAIVSGDTCAQRKPHPEPVEYACKLLNVPTQHTWFIGDAGRDMEAGRAAGCQTIGATYGYIYPDDPIENWDSDCNITKPLDLISLLNKASAIENDAD